MTYAEIKINVNANIVGYIGLILNIVGLFLPWLNMFYYYDYYYPWEFIGLFGIGIFSVIGSFLAFFGLLRKSRTLLAAAGLLNIYNAGGVIAFLTFYFMPGVIGIGAIICLVAGILLLIVAFLYEGTNHQTMNHNRYQMSTVSNILPGYNRIADNTNYHLQQYEYSPSHPIIRYCRFCGMKLR